jgi:hypothetical protein
MPDDSLDIIDVIGRHVEIRLVGRRWQGLCPFHAETSPSFSVNAQEGLFYCFGCGAKGDAAEFTKLIAQQGADAMAEMSDEDIARELKAAYLHFLDLLEASCVREFGPAAALDVDADDYMTRIRWAEPNTRRLVRSWVAGQRREAAGQREEAVS